MAAKASFPTEPRQRNRIWRPLPRGRRVNVERLHAGIAWLIRHIVFVRLDLNVAELAREAGLSDQSVRDYLDLKHPEGWHTESHLTQALGYVPDELERLTWRWMRLYRRRERRKHAGEDRWTLLYPWEPRRLAEAEPERSGTGTKWR
ncbi:hypothetical protein [Prosthecobacter sp.]|uniref:hypothetical protein n=1 Tax=Prosthecobacter sp. TaxID=1965333 RepID=UPI002ABAB3BE|nr:hypothetical protein [Prosthecobacter sp.]MDZ4405853.1 hypothetical protein [Prosthecobacter sp.]